MSETGASAVLPAAAAQNAEAQIASSFSPYSAVKFSFTVMEAVLYLELVLKAPP